MSTQTHPDAHLHAYPSLAQIRDTADRLAGKILRTPVWHWQTGIIEDQFKGVGEVWLKLELFQKTGTFKLRGALNCIAALDEAARQRGVVAVSAGNHAMAVAYTARLTGCSAKVVMPQHASPARIAACREQGAQVLLMPDVHQAFARGREIERDEARTMLHPYDGPLTAQGTATVGLELMAQVPGLEAVVVPVGGGGLCAGIAAAVKQINPNCAVYGVEHLWCRCAVPQLPVGRAGNFATRGYRCRQLRCAVCDGLQLWRVSALCGRGGAGDG